MILNSSILKLTEFDWIFMRELRVDTMHLENKNDSIIFQQFLIIFYYFDIFLHVIRKNIDFQKNTTGLGKLRYHRLY